MNREEAIKFFELQTQDEQALIDGINLNPDDFVFGAEGPEQYINDCQNNIDAYETAISALRSPQPDPIAGLVPCGFCENPKKLMEDGYYQVTQNTKWLPDIGDLVCTHSGEYAIFAIDGCEDDTFLCQGMTACPMCGRKLRVAE